MAVTSVSYQITPEGKRQNRRVVTENGTPGEIADVLAGEHRCSPRDVVIHRRPAGPLAAPQTTGNPLPANVHQGAVERVDSAMVKGLHNLPDETGIPSAADINGMRKQQLYDLAALHSVPVDDDPAVAELKKRLVKKLHG